MKPMLAHKYNDHRKKVRFPCIVQPKLNGVRALYSEGKFQSRDGHFWNDCVLLHIRYALQAVPPNLILDGELYVHGWSLQKINGAASVNRVEPRNDTFKIEYYVFDVFDKNYSDCPMWGRRAILIRISDYFGPKVHPVETYVCTDEYTLESYFKAFTTSGYEGLMYRDYDAPYGHESACRNKENRWPTLLKRKDWLDDWFTVIDYKEGQGKYTGQVGSLVCELPNGLRFEVGGGLSDIQRVEFMQCPPTQVHVKYEMLSDSGIPLKPTFLE